MKNLPKPLFLFAATLHRLEDCASPLALSIAPASPQGDRLNRKLGAGPVCTTFTMGTLTRCNSVHCKPNPVPVLVHHPH